MATVVLEASNSNTKVTITGLNENASVSLDEETKTVTISKDVLGTSDVTIKSEKNDSTGSAAVTYKLALDPDVYEEEYLWSAPVINQNAKAGSPITVTYKYQTTTNFKLGGSKIIYSKTPIVKTQNIFTISGVNNTTLITPGKNEAPSSEKIAELFGGATGKLDEAMTITPTNDAFTTANMVINTANKLANNAKHSIELPSDGVATSAEYSYQWSFNNPTAAAYKETKNLYYEDNTTSEDSVKPNTIKYNAAKTSAIATVNGISKTFKTNCEDDVLIDNGYKTGEEGSKVLSDEVFRTAVLGVKTSYGEGETAPTDVDALLAAKAAYDKSLGTKTDNTAKANALNAAKTAYFKDATVMGQVSTKIAEKIVVAGADSLEAGAQLTPSGNITVDSSLFDNKNITLAKGNNTNTPATKATFTLAIDTENYTAPETEYAWSFSGNTGATYKQTQPAFYTVDEKTGAIKYTATKTSTLATLNGLNPNFKTGIEDEITAGITITVMDGTITEVTEPTDPEATDYATNLAVYNVYVATVAAQKAYKKSLYGAEEPNSTQIANFNKLTPTAQDSKKANALKQAKAAYLKDENIAKTVSDKIDDVIGGNVLTTTTSSDGPTVEGAITIGTDALGATNITLVQGKPLDSKDKTSYTLALGTGVMDGTAENTMPTVMVNSTPYALVVTGATAKLQKLSDNGSAKYEPTTQGNNQIIKYTKPTVSNAAADTLFTITGLKAGIVADGAGNLDEFIKVNDDHTITLTSKALGTANIVLKDTDASNDWKLSVTENTDNNIYAPTYEADTNGATTTPAESNSDGRQAGNNSSIDPASHDDEGDGESTSTETPQSTADLAWSATKGTAKLIQTIKKGHTLSHDGKTIYYNAGTGKNVTKEIVLATVTGLNTSIDSATKADEALDYSFTKTTGEGDNAVTTDAPVIKVNSKALGGKVISVNGTGNFELGFIEEGDNKIVATSGSKLGKAEPTEKALTLTSANAKYSTILGPGYSIDTTGKKINYLAKGTKETVYAQISGFATLYKDLSAEAKAEVTETSMKNKPAYPPAALSAEDAEDTEKQAAYNAAKATYEANKSYYDALNAAYKAYSEADKTNALKAAQQAYIDSKANEVIVFNENVFTIHADALTSKTNIILNTKEEYTIALDADEDIPKKAENLNASPAWVVKGTTATYQDYTGEYYDDYSDATSAADIKKKGKQIIYVREKLDPTVLVKLTGINKDATAADFGTTTETEVVLKYGALGTTPIVMTASGTFKDTLPKLYNNTENETDTGNVKYQGDTAETAKATLTEQTGWIISGTTATYQTFTPAYYVIDTGNNKITYNAISDKGPAFITLTGLKSGLTTNANGVIDDISVVMYDKDGKVTEDNEKLDHYGVVVQAGALDTKNGGKVTIKGTDDYADATLALSTESGNYSDGTAKAPKAIAEGDLAFSYNGANVVLKAKEDTAGYVCDGKTITYSDGSANRPTLASIAGLATDLKASSSVEGEKAVLGEVVKLSGGKITLSKSALNAKAVTLTTTGAYELGLATDDATKEVTATATIAPKYSGSNVVFEQGLNASTSAPKYDVDSTGKKINYYTSANPTTLATISGVKADLNATQLAAAVLIDTEDKVITINEAAFDTNNNKNTTIKTATKDYTLALGKDSADTPADLTDVFDGITPALDYNDKTKKVELVRTAKQAGWGISADKKSIVYYAKGDNAPALATITGLNVDKDTDLTDVIKVGDVENDTFTESETTGENPVATYEGKVIQISADALGTSNVSVTGTDYTLALKDDDVPINSNADLNGWIVSGTKATYNTDGKKAYYALNAKNTGITYTAPKAGTPGVVVSGLKSGILPDNDGVIAGLAIDATDNKKINIDYRVLGTTNVTVTGEGYKLNPVFEKGEGDTITDDMIIDKTTTSYKWAVNGNTVNLQQIVTAGFKLNDAGTALEYTAAKTTNVGTLTGYNPNIKTDAEFDAANFVTADAMESKIAEVKKPTDETNTTEVAKYEKDLAEYEIKIAAQKAYNKSLYGSEDPKADTKTDAQKATNFATKQATALTAAKNAYINAAMTETLNSYLTLGKVTGEGAEAIFAADETGTAWLVNDKNLLGQGDLKLAGNNNFTLTLVECGFETAAKPSEAWIVNGTTAEYYATGYNSESYTASTDGKSISYHEAKKIGEGELKPTITLTGLKSGLKSGSWDNFGVKVEGDTVTLTQAVLPTSGTLAISGDVPKAESETETTESTNYKLALNKVIESDVSSSTAAANVPEIELALNNTTATLKQDQKKGYVLNADNTELTYINADRTATLATITNLSPDLKTSLDKAKDALKATDFDEELDEDDSAEKKAAYAAYTAATDDKLAAAKEAYFNAALSNAIDIGDGKVITLSEDAIIPASKAKRVVTITSSDGYTITAGENEAKPNTDAAYGTGGYQWTLSGNNASYKYTTKTGPVTSADYKTITYYPDGNTATLVTITGYNKNLTTATTFASAVNVNGKVIELNKDALEGTTAVKISTKNSGYSLALSNSATSAGLRDAAEVTKDGEADWVFDTANGKAEYVACTRAYYKKDDADAPQTLTYTPAAKTANATAIFTIEGLKKNVQFTPEDVVYKEPTAEAGQDPSITLSGTALDGITAATLKIAGTATEAQNKAKLALGKDTSGTQMTAIAATDPKNSPWIVSGTKAELTQSRPKGYEISEDGKTITRIASDQTAVLATVNGVPNYTTEATSFVTKDAMEKDISETDTNKAALTAAQTAYTDAYDAKLVALKVEGNDAATRKTNATTAQKTQAETAGLTAAKAAYINKKVGDALKVGTTEVETTTTSTNENDEEVTSTSKTNVPAITVNKDALGTAEVTITRGKDVNGKDADNYIFALADAVPTSKNVTNKDAWLVSGTTAEFVNCVPEHYDISNGKIIYTAIAKAKKVDGEGKPTTEDAEATIVITGLKSGATASGISEPTEEGKVITLSRDVLSTTEATKITTGNTTYKLAFNTSSDTGTDLLKEVSLKLEWTGGATSTYIRTQPAKTYVLSKDETSITYSATAKTTTLATITGLNSVPRLAAPTKNEETGIETIAIAGNQIASTKNVTVDGVGYTFSFADSYSGTVDSTTSNVTSYAKITGGANADVITTAGEALEIGGGAGDDTISNTAGDNLKIDGGAGNDSITTTGKNHKIGGGAGNDTISSTTGDNLEIDGGEGDDTITANGTGLKINGGAGNDTITAGGTDLEIAGGTGDDTITLGEAERTKGNKIVFEAGDGDDVVAKFKSTDFIKTSVAADSITIDRPDDPNGDVVINFGTNNGSITLTSYGKETAIKFLDSSDKPIEGVEGATKDSRSLLYSDNFMETTPVLSSITDITANDYSVGNIEGAADLTKLTKEETPIIASSK